MEDVDSTGSDSILSPDFNGRLGLGKIKVRERSMKLQPCAAGA